MKPEKVDNLAHCKNLFDVAILLRNIDTSQASMFDDDVGTPTCGWDNIQMAIYLEVFFQAICQINPCSYDLFNRELFISNLSIIKQIAHLYILQFIKNLDYDANSKLRVIKSLQGYADSYMGLNRLNWAWDGFEHITPIEEKMLLEIYNNLDQIFYKCDTHSVTVNSRPIYNIDIQALTKGEHPLKFARVILLDYRGKSNMIPNKFLKSLKDLF